MKNKEKNFFKKRTTLIIVGVVCSVFLGLFILDNTMPTSNDIKPHQDKVGIWKDKENNKIQIEKNSVNIGGNDIPGITFNNTKINKKNEIELNKPNEHVSLLITFKQNKEKETYLRLVNNSGNIPQLIQNHINKNYYIIEE